MSATLFIVALYLAWTTYFLSQHIGEDNEFFIEFDRRARGRYTPGLYVACAPLTIGGLVLLAMGHTLLAGALGGPTALVDLLVVGRLTGVARDLPTSPA